MYKFLRFNPTQVASTPLETNKDVPNELDIFFKDYSQFIPEGKVWDQLTQQEKEHVKNQYRFQSFRPGKYQTITGLRGMI